MNYQTYTLCPRSIFRPMDILSSFFWFLTFVTGISMAILLFFYIKKPLHPLVQSTILSLPFIGPLLYPPLF